MYIYIYVVSYSWSIKDDGVQVNIIIFDEKKTDQSKVEANGDDTFVRIQRINLIFMILHRQMYDRLDDTIQFYTNINTTFFSKYVTFICSKRVSSTTCSSQDFWNIKKDRTSSITSRRHILWSDYIHEYTKCYEIPEGRTLLE